jgi:DNA topoisomerase I
LAASKALVIVESPAKAKTIKKYLGKNYTVKASVGHVMDLPTKELGVDVKKNFTPTYVVMKGKKTVLDEIAAEAKKVDEIFLAPDPDREGEAIAKHIADYITTKLKKDKKPIHRILVNEITAKGVKAAIDNPLEIDINMFNSQQARRILDRLVGYKISPILWKKVRRGLSAGRVQSVAVRLIVERETTIDNFKPVEYWVLEADFLVGGKNKITTKLFKINGKKPEVATKVEADEILNAAKNGNVFISDIEKKEKRRNPLPPFITSKLQQDASRKLKYTPKRTMAIAQGLYEGVELGEEGSVGLITYMRTDSVRVGDDAKKAALSYIKATYGDEYAPAKPNFYKTKGSAQDAHEAIRPTSTDNSPERIKKYLSPEQLKLYTLIWNRFIASQMTPSVYDQTAIDFNIAGGKTEYTFRATGSVLKFAGFEKVYMEAHDEDEEEEGANTLPEVKKTDEAKLADIKSEQKFTQPPARFNEATLIKELEENGIGRPSTYASIISTIQDRGYVEKEANQLRPTDLGKMVTELLVTSFPVVLDVEFTAGMEESLDKIEEGKLKWVDVLGTFYVEFEKALKEADKSMRNIKGEETPTDVDCPKCGKKMIIKWGRNGQFLACPDYPTCKSTSNFTKKEGDGSIQMEQAETTDEKCPTCGGGMLVKRGRFGKFLACADYPKCKGTKSITTGVICPECGKGDLGEKRTKKGKVFYSCSKYPECKFAIWNKPVTKTCTACGSKIMEEKKDEYVCVNKECGHKEPREPK